MYELFCFSTKKAYYQMHKKGTQRTLLIISTPATDISGGRC